MASRWDLLLEQKPVRIIDHLVEEVSKLLAKDLAKWPLPIEELDPAAGQQFAALFEIDSRRPAPPVFAEAFRLARWELGKEFDAIDEYMRNRRWLERGLALGDKLALLFVSRWLVEQLMALRESTDSRVTRPMLLKCLESTERRWGQS